jgi:hypothetical protein
MKIARTVQCGCAVMVNLALKGKASKHTRSYRGLSIED